MVCRDGNGAGLGWVLHSPYPPIIFFLDLYQFRLKFAGIWIYKIMQVYKIRRYLDFIKIIFLNILLKFLNN